MEQSFEQLDLLEQFMSLYIEVLPAVYAEKTLDKEDIPTFDQFKDRWPLHYQHQVYAVDGIRKSFVNPLGHLVTDHTPIVKLPVKSIPKGSPPCVMYQPQIPDNILVTKYHSAIFFAGQKIKKKEL